MTRIYLPDPNLPAVRRYLTERRRAARQAWWAKAALSFAGAWAVLLFVFAVMSDTTLK